MFTLTLTAAPDFSFTYNVEVPDGVECRAHDVRIVLDSIVATFARQGANRLPTVSEAAEERKKIDDAKALLAQWEPTLDGVTNMNGVYSRMFRHTSGIEQVAVCDAHGEPTLETAAALAAWTPGD